ncbi:MAG: universal stress protein [Chloroflexi bacterium]|nr:universal stress protein [Chloroflexota bacterium]MCL5074737.1 universal stress protein [Chloroflexota bacterium]
MKVRRVLVPVSGNRIDAEVVRTACNMAKNNKAHVYVIYVIEVNRALPLDAEIEPESQKGEQLLDQAMQIAEEADFDDIDTELLQSRDVGSAIVDEAAERSADIIIMGIPYKKRFGEFSIGRTANYVLKNAPCYVWVLREQISELE